MARAETLESAGGGGGRGGAEGERGGPGPLVQPSTCRMELPRPGFHHWSGLLTATAATAATGYGLHRDQTPALPPPLAQLLPEGPLLPPRPPCTRREEDGPRAETRVGSGERPAPQRTGSEGEERRDEPGPAPDTRPPDQRPSRGSAPRRPPGDPDPDPEDIRRVAHQLRAIGDQINATVMHRAHAAPQWRDWRSACLQLLNFVTQTLNTLYRLT